MHVPTHPTSGTSRRVALVVGAGAGMWLASLTSRAVVGAVALGSRR